jgi:MFS family permease
MLTRDARLLISGQAVRAAGYGFTAVLLGVLLAGRGYSHLRVGVVLSALIAGTAISSLLVGVLSDRVGRRVSYALFFTGVAVAGVVVAVGAPFGVLLVVALTGTLSTDVVDNGPATTLEQAMLAADDAGTSRVYGLYNAVGAGAGALGALATAAPGVRGAGQAPVHGWLFLVLVPVGLVGAALASRLSRAVEADDGPLGLARVLSARSRLGPSRSIVTRLSALFAVDAAGGGLATTAFLSYLFSTRYGVSAAALGWLFFAVSAVQVLSVALAPRLADRYGLVATMVGSHLPSNVLLAAVGLAPTFPVAVGLLLTRTLLSQMDVPTRQALVMSVVRPQERTAAAAVTNAARYTVRPVGPLVAGAVQHLALGAPLVLAGGIKAGYDLVLWRWARHLPAGARSRATCDAVSTPLAGGEASSVRTESA